jgi:hypothetical protein
LPYLFIREVAALSHKIKILFTRRAATPLGKIAIHLHKRWQLSHIKLKYSSQEGQLHPWVKELKRSSRAHHECG